jgi:hypothetical protein
MTSAFVPALVVAIADRWVAADMGVLGGACEYTGPATCEGGCTG